MRFWYHLLLTGLIILLEVTPRTNTFAQQWERSPEHESRKAEAWPVQAISKKTVRVSAARSINFQRLADYEKTHPALTESRFIKQGEDLDAEYHFVPGEIPRGTPVFDPNQLSPKQSEKSNHTEKSLQAGSPAPAGYFYGTSENESSPTIPPDVDGAAGPSYVMETNNQQFDIFTKTGTLQGTLSIDSFFPGGISGEYFDPHILYDNNYSRFIVVSDGFVTDSDGGLFIAISETSDPTGNWYTYFIDDGDTNRNHLLDYPEVGYNNNWVVITADDFAGGSAPVGDIYILDRATLYNGAFTASMATLFTDNNAFAWAPAQTYDLSEDTLWMVQSANGNSGGNGAMQIGYISGSAASPVYNPGNDIGVTQTWNNNSINVGQLGSNELIDDDDGRVGNGSVYIHGTLWFTHTVFLPDTGTPANSGVDWWQIIPSSLTLKQFGRIADNNGNTNYYYPSLNVNSNGDALLGYCLSGTDSFYPSAGYSFHAAGDPVNYMEARYIYKPGASYYYQILTGLRNRYGDFTGTSVDPNDQSFWNFSEYPVDTSQWGIVIAHIAASIPPVNPPVANFMTNDTLVTCNGLVQFTDLSTNVPTSWLWNFGDGATSTLQNPSHQYTVSGAYTVTLKATNAHGSGTQTFGAYVTVQLAPGPAAANVSHCRASSFSLSASTTNNVGWFDSTGTLVSSSNPFVTPVLSHNTTYWVKDTIPPSIDSVGPPTYASLGAGGIYSDSYQHYLQFDALSNFTLISVLVDADTSGTRTIQLLNSANTVLATATPNIPVGVSTVTLNFAVPAGKGYELALGGNVNLYRNDAGNFNDTANYYPFTLPGIVSINGSDAGQGFYYYFYNWKVQGPTCVSAETPVSAIISAASLSLTPSITGVACYGQATGSVSLTVSGGIPGYNYRWSNGQTDSLVNNLIAGNYKVTVTDQGGCTSTASETITQPTAALAVSAGVINVACYGASTGAVNLTVTGGTAPYSYHWSDGRTAHNLTHVAAGTYSVTVTDAHSCTATASATVTENPAISLHLTAVNTGCGTSATGSVTASATGGIPEFNYRWSNGQTGITATNLTAGPYTVTVTDSAGCTASASATVAQNNSNLSISPGVTNATCYGAATGAITLTVSGGTAGYTYAWGGGITTQNRTALTSGTYTVTVTDTNSCTVSGSITVNQPTAVTGVTSVVNSGCGVSSTGSASVVASGGTPGYTYVWSNSQTTDTISNLIGGTYVVTITDSLACTGTASAVVNNAGPLALDISFTSGQCFGFSNGSASVTETGGTGNIAYHWSNGGSGSSIFNLIAGVYAVTVSDGAGCTNTASTTVTQPGAALSVNLTPSPAACGVSDGSVAAAASGGTPGYRYHWNTGDSTQAIGGLGGGFYSVTVTDDSSCTVSSTSLVVSSSSLAANLISSSATCYGLNNGGTSVNVISGTPPYTYLWNTNGTGSSISNLYAGIYYVTITDSFGCQSYDSIIVNQPSDISIVVNVLQPVCNGVLTGSASVTDSGGTPGYTYAWSNNSIDSSVTGLPAGNYTVTVLDTKDCSATAQLSVQAVSDVTASIASENDSCYGAGDGSARVTPSGGAIPYSYLWSNSDTTASVSGLAAGPFAVTVTDNNHCSASATATVSQPDEIMISVSSTNATGGQSNGSTTVDSITGGTAPYIINWSDGQPGKTYSNLSAGTYTVTVTDHNGCQQTASATVNKASGITNVTGGANFDLYPNPAGTQVIIELQIVGNETTICLRNVLGQTLYSSPVSSLKTTIDLSSYANGIYFVEVSSAHSGTTRKLIIDR